MTSRILVSFLLFVGACGDGRAAWVPPTPDAPSTTFVGNGALGDIDITAAAADAAASLVQFNVDDGSVKMGEHVIVPAHSAGFSVVAQASGPEVAMWQFNSFSIAAGVRVMEAGSMRRVLAIVAKTSLEIDGKIDVRAYGGSLGLAGTDGQAVGVGAVGGGGHGSTAGGEGGGGGGHSIAGDAEHLIAGLGRPISGTGGQAYGDPQMSTVFLGSGGGGGACGALGECSGGNGGGAIALFATSLVIKGELNADGTTPVQSISASVGGGGGGGSGGSIALSGDSIVLADDYALYARGGSGGLAVNLGADGGAGAPGRIVIATAATGLRLGELNAEPTPFEAGASWTEFPRAAK